MYDVCLHSDSMSPLSGTVKQRQKLGTRRSVVNAPSSRLNTRVSESSRSEDKLIGHLLIYIIMKTKSFSVPPPPRQRERLSHYRLPVY